MKSEKEYKQDLTPEQYHILREKGTEPAFTGKYWNHHEDGVYRCIQCDAQIFSSETKFDSGTGWPSFSDVLKSDAVKLKEDFSLGMKRIEVTCAKCGGHLGHVFPDGPKPKCMRYCINSAVLDFRKRNNQTD